MSIVHTVHKLIIIIIILPTSTKAAGHNAQIILTLSWVTLQGHFTKLLVKMNKTKRSAAG